MDEAHIEGQIATVQAHWHHHQLLTETYLRRLDQLLGSFVAFASRAGADTIAVVTPEICRSYVTARTRRRTVPALATCHLRRTALRTLFTTARQLGMCETNPALQVELPARDRRTIRPLTVDELGLVRATALGAVGHHDAHVATIALLETGATTGEVPQLTTATIDITARTVRLPGATPVQPRTVELTHWAARVLAPVLKRAEPDRSLTYTGPDPTAHTAQAATVNRVRKILRHAGLDEPAIRPTSIRLALPAQDLADGGRVEHAAHRLGLTSLDATCDALGHDWGAA